MNKTVALAMIARDAETTIGRCIESVRGLVDNVYIVDTGSVDSTADVCRALGAVVVPLAWPGRFDVAVNFAYERVVEDWTLRLDSDEWLLPESVELILQTLQSSAEDMYSLIRRDFKSDGSFSEMWMPRLTRTRCGLRVKGRIHEAFPRESLSAVRCSNLPARFLHDGLASTSDSKLQRNVHLLRQELEELPQSLYYRIELARTLCRLQDPSGQELVREIADELLSLQHLDQMPDGLCGDLLATALDDVKDQEFAAPRTDALVRLARGWCSRLPATTWAVAQLQIRRGKLREALDALLDLECMLVTDDYDLVGGFHRGEIERGTWLNLALVAHQLGRKEIARRNYDRVLVSEPENLQVLNNLAIL